MSGRPRIGTRHNIIIPDSDWANWCGLASAVGLTVSEWLRQAGNTKAGQQAVQAEPPSTRVRKSKVSRRRPA